MTTININDFKKLIEQNPNIELLDVREPSERTEFNIGGHFIPLGNIMSFQFDEIEHLKETELFVYCRSGKRSLQACMFLEQAGFEHIVNIEGGMLAWQSQTT